MHSSLMHVRWRLPENQQLCCTVTRLSDADISNRFGARFPDEMKHRINQALLFLSAACRSQSWYQITEQISTEAREWPAKGAVYHCVGHNLTARQKMTTTLQHTHRQLTQKYHSV